MKSRRGSACRSTIDRMSHTPARFRFSSPGLDVEFEGHPDFVAGQIDHFRDRIEAELARAAEERASAPTAAASPRAETAPAAAAAVPAADAAAQPATPAEPPTLEGFYRNARSREGRGALQDSILLFAYFLREYRGTDEFSVDNLTACFSVVGVAPPSSLANTLGVMRRTQKLFDSGSRRGLYRLTAKAEAYVRSII